MGKRFSFRDLYQDIWGSAGGRYVNLRILGRIIFSSTPGRVLQFLRTQILNGRVRNGIKRQKSHNLFLPKSIIIELGYSCNLNCRDCYAPKTSDHKLDRDALESIVSQGEKLGVYRYVLMGGEPTLKVHRKEILPVIRKHRRSFFTFCTNGTQIDDALIKELKPMKNLAFLISLEGSQEVTDRRRGEGIYNVVLDGIKRLKKARISSALTITLEEDRWREQISDRVIGDYVHAGGIVIYTHAMVQPDSALLQNVPTVPLLLQYQRLVQKYSIFLTDGVWGKMTSRGIVPRDLNQVIIDPQGGVRPWRFRYDTYMGNLFQQSLKEILANEELIQLKKKARKNSQKALDEFTGELKELNFGVFSYDRKIDSEVMSC